MLKTASVILSLVMLLTGNTVFAVQAAAELVSTGIASVMEGEGRDVSVLLADLKNYSSFADRFICRCRISNKKR